MGSRISPQVPIGLDDFLNSGYLVLLEGAKRRECINYFQTLLNEALQTSAAGELKKGAAFRILGLACIPSLDVDDASKPFGANGILHRELVPALSDSLGKDWSNLARFAHNCKDPELQARLADLLWVLNRDPEMAELAVAAYLETSKALQDPENWVACAERAERALQISMLLRRQDLVDQAISHVVGIILRYDGNDPSYLTTRLLEVLLENGKADPQKLLPIATKAAEAAEAVGNWRKANFLWLSSAKLHKLLGDENGSGVALRHAAETHVREAENAPSQMVAARFWEDAVQAHRQAGSTSDVVERLHKKMLDAQRRMMGELRDISVPFDVSPEVKRSRDSVKGKALNDAILELAGRGLPGSRAKLLKIVKQEASKNPLQHLFHKTLVEKEGKTVSRIPSVVTNDETEKREAMEALLVQKCALFQEIYASSVFNPMRQQIVAEHQVTLDVVRGIVRGSTFIPPEREEIFARGLHHGFQGDFLEAAHLLIPQLENSCRSLLSTSGTISSSLDSRGIQKEWDLNRMLLRKPTQLEVPTALEKQLGEDLTLHLKAALVHPAGPNMRNRLAHGLTDFSSSDQLIGTFIWWVVLKLCVGPPNATAHDP